MVISTTPINNCIICNYHSRNTNSGRKLCTVPSNIIHDLYLKKVIIKCGSQICQHVCLDIYRFKQIKHKDLYQTEIYSPYKHNISNKYLTESATFASNLLNKYQQSRQQIEELKQNIINLEKRVVPYSKYSRVKLVKDYDYASEAKTIPKKDKSNCWNNHVQYQLMSEADCKMHTGFDRSVIIKQAEICGTIPELVFHLRCWIYRYEPRVLHAARFGWSPDKLSTWMFGHTLPLMHKKYAKAVLVSDRETQFFTRQVIHNKCPNFPYHIRRIPRDADVNFMTIDSTYQFIEEINTDFMIRKHTTNMHKHANLIKIHIWCCGNGQPTFAQYIYGDGYHADGKAFAAALNKSHMEKCKKVLIKKQKLQKNEKKLKKNKNNITTNIINNSNKKKIDNKSELLNKKNKEALKKIERSLKIIEKELNKIEEKLKKCSFTDLSDIAAYENLRRLIKIYDQIVCDAGYHLRHRHPALKSHGKAPANDDEGGQVSVVQATHKRGMMAIRNGQERMHHVAKCNKFCRSKINGHDIWKIPKVWDIVLSDIVYGDVKLSKDSDTSLALAALLQDLQYCVINPIDIFWLDKKVEAKNRNKAKPTNQAVTTDHKNKCIVEVGDIKYCQICGVKYNSQTWADHQKTDHHLEMRAKWWDVADNTQSQRSRKSQSQRSRKSQSQTSRKSQ